MTDRPILFSGPMVRALIDGRKTQTRRILKPQPGPEGIYPDIKSAKKALRIVRHDRLWVREAAVDLTDYMDAPVFKNRASPYAYKADGDFIGCHHWRPGIHMPRKLSRLTLTVTDVRVQRLQDLTHADALAEGVEMETADPPFYYVPGMALPDPTRIGVEVGQNHAERAYAALWDHINGAGAWAANPWVAAYTFTVERRNIDASAAEAA